MANATSTHLGAVDPQIPGCPLGGTNLGILGLGPLASGPDPNNFSVDSVNDAAITVIGGNALGNMVLEPTTFAAGSGYPDGPYRVQSVGGGAANGTASVDFLVTGGAIAWARVSRPGSGFTGAPTFTVANAVNLLSGATITGGTGGTITVTVGNAGFKPTSMIVPAANKTMRRLVATGPVAIDAAVTPSTYLNKSGRALVAGDEVWAVAP